MNKNVLLLNPPGRQQYLREYYCPKVSKADFYYPPVDLVYTSSWFDESYSLHVLDSIAENVNNEQVLSAIRRDRIDIIYVLISGPSFKEDKVLIEHIRLKFPKIIIIGTGDLFRELREESFKRLPQLDAVNLNFSTDGVVTYLTQASGHPIPNILYRWRGSIVCGQEIFPKKHNRLGIPRWDLFPVKKYRYPFAVAKPNVAMLTDFGCTFQCSFCPHGEIDFSLRPRQDVYDEIDNLIKLGIKDIFFFDQTFGVNKPATNELCKFLSERDIHWTCFSRVDLLSDETAAMMANAGCHTVIFGIESADEDL